MKGFDDGQHFPGQNKMDENANSTSYLLFAIDQWLELSDYDTWLIWFSHVLCEWDQLRITGICKIVGD